MSGDRCSAIVGEYRCRATASLTHVRIVSGVNRNLVLPEMLVVYLCPKHFVWTDDMRLELGIKEGK